MTVDQLTRHFGGATAAARALGVTRVVIYQWKNRGFPWQWQCAAEIVTEGELVADRSAVIAPSR